MNKKEEAISRIKMIDFHENVLKDFRHDVINYSEPVKISPGAPVFGCLYWLDNKPEWVDIVKKIEEENDILVYHVTYEHTEIGETLTMLYVSSYEEEWEMDRDLLRVANGPNARFTPLAYVYNLSDPILSEFGYVEMKTAGGGLVRTA